MVRHYSSAVLVSGGEKPVLRNGSFPRISNEENTEKVHASSMLDVNVRHWQAYFPRNFFSITLFHQVIRSDELVSSSQLNMFGEIPQELTLFLDKFFRVHRAAVQHP
ncbi:uncharacterized protein BT62DRAFT_94510 [Guyanagaster necrorhizus]|uniref:Uncharacterized protein n=1 Tax=Guyanagaster necrorhizus TaxID=856835 RepID=A0A9P7VU22_9AGAR|nr:uncharacterized protein BT62DRAFT_94510 [Guyanagaster necrorhizus MCA 3950]KAG7446949.1 hypothetical protein BT62DRAFT_94510 [Guyanagaster necrorhizus MCA 3950]